MLDFLSPEILDVSLRRSYKTEATVAQYAPGRAQMSLDGLGFIWIIKVEKPPQVRGLRDVAGSYEILV